MIGIWGTNTVKCLSFSRYYNTFLLINSNEIYSKDNFSADGCNVLCQR